MKRPVLKKLSLEQVKALPSGTRVYLEEIGVEDSEHDCWCTVIRFEDAPDAIYLRDAEKCILHKFKFESLDEVYGKYWLIYN